MHVLWFRGVVKRRGNHRATGSIKERSMEYEDSKACSEAVQEALSWELLRSSTATLDEPRCTTESAQDRQATLYAEY